MGNFTFYSTIWTANPVDVPKTEWVIFKYYNMVSGNLLCRLDWLSVENRLKLDTACFMFKVAHNAVPDTISKMFMQVNEVSQYVT